VKIMWSNVSIIHVKHANKACHAFLKCLSNTSTLCSQWRQWGECESSSGTSRIFVRQFAAYLQICIL